MKHRLSITIDTSPVWEVQAETNLGPSPQFSIPESISGKLLNMTEAEVLKLDNNNSAVVGFEGYPYLFTSLDTDGNFILSRIKPLS